MAFGEMGISPSDFYNEYTYSDWIYKCWGHRKAQEDKWRHTRLIVAAISKKDPRSIVELPGDFDHLKNVNKIDNSKQLEILEKISNGRSKN